MSTPTMLTPEKWDELASINDELCKRANAREDQDEAIKKALAELIPGTADELVKYACIDVTQKDQVTNLLNDHIKCVQFVKKLAAKVATPEPIGTPEKAVTKQANEANRQVHDQLSSPSAVDLLEKSRSWNRAG